jgi:hypothetical protein
MTTQLSVSADPQAEASGGVSAVVASLPLSFGPAAGTPDAGMPDVIAVAGRAGWTGRASEAIRSGARGVVVSAPVAEDLAGLTATASAAGSVVVLDQQWAGNVALAESSGNVRGVIADAIKDAVLLDSVAVAPPGTDPLNLLTEHLAVILQCGIDLHEVRLIQRSGNGYTVAGVLAGGVPAALQGIITSALPSTASVSILTSAGRADVVLPDPAAAWPAEVRTVTAEGATTLPTLYESSHRTSWSRVRSHLSSGNPANDLARFTAVTSLLSQLNS